MSTWWLNNSGSLLAWCHISSLASPIYTWIHLRREPGSCYLAGHRSRRWAQVLAGEGSLQGKPQMHDQSTSHKGGGTGSVEVRFGTSWKGVLKAKVSGIDWKPWITQGTKDHRFLFIGSSWVGRRAELPGWGRQAGPATEQQLQSDVFFKGMVNPASLHSRKSAMPVLSAGAPFLRHPLQMSYSLCQALSPSMRAYTGCSSTALQPNRPTTEFTC